MEAQVALVVELQDFFRKRAELELDYSKSLDKMARSIQLRHKEQKQKYDKYIMSINSVFYYIPFYIIKNICDKKECINHIKIQLNIQFHYLRNIGANA